MKLARFRGRLLPPQITRLPIWGSFQGHELDVLKGTERTILNNRIILQIEIFEPQQRQVFPFIEGLGLRRVAEHYPDYFFTNIKARELGY